MNRFGLVTLAGALACVALVGASCGGDELSDAALPPMYTTTTSTTSLTTTTVAGQGLYAIAPGDQLGNIAAGWNVDMQELMDLNGITNPDKIQVGQVLNIPPSTAEVALTLPTP